MVHKSEDQLTRIVCSAKSGDPAALAELFQSTYPHIYYHAYILTGNPHDAEDLLQEGYIKCFLAIDTLQDPCAFYPWMWSILKNIRRNQLRKQPFPLLSPEQLEAEEQHLLDRLVEDDDSPAMQVEKKELSKILSCMIYALPPEQQEVIVLHYYDGLTLSQIAEKQSCPLSTVKSRLRYAKSSLKQAIEAEEHRSGVSLHSSFLIPVLPTFFAKMSDYIVLPVPTAIAIFTTVAGFFGITVTGDAIKLLGTTTTEEHPIRNKAIIVRIRILPCVLMGLCLLLTIGLLVGNAVYTVATPEEIDPPVTAGSETDAAASSEALREVTYPQLCLISAEGVEGYTIHVGQTFAMQYYCIPYSTTCQEVEIYSLNSDVARVDGKQITGVMPGETRIYFRNLHDPNQLCSMVLYVQETPAETAPIESVEFQSANLNTLLPGDVFSLNYICVPYVAEAEELYFTSDDPAVATYDGANLYAHAAGTTTIRCKRAVDDTELGYITLQVYPDTKAIPVVEPYAVIFYTNTQELQVGDQLTLPYTCLPGTADVDTWYWEITDPAVVDFDGVTVTALAPGKAYIHIHRTSDKVSIGQILYTVTP